MRTIRFIGAGILFFALTARSMAQTPQNKEEAQTGAQAGIAPATIEFPTSGFSVESPTGWKRVPETRMGYIAHWIRTDIARGQVRAELLIEMEPIQGQTLQQRAEELVKTAGATISQEKITLADEPALHLQFKDQKPGSAQHEAILGDREKDRFILECTGKGENVTGVLGALRKSWKWLPLAPPTAHLDFLPEPISILDGRLRLNMPEIMRIFPLEQPDQLKLAIYDARTQILALVVDIQILPNSPSLSLRRIRDSFATRVQDQFKLDKAIVWRDISGRMPGFLSDTFGPLHVEKDYTAYAQYGLAKLPKEKLVLWTVTMTGQDPESRKIYEAVAEKMIASAAGSSAKP